MTPIYNRPFKVSLPERRTYNGVIYASRTEARYAEHLDTLISTGSVSWWIGQPTFRLGCSENKYRPDFLCVETTGIVYAVDVKAAKGDTTAFRRTKKLWRLYGPCRLVVARPQGKGWKHEEV